MADDQTWTEWINDKIRMPEDRKREHYKKFHVGPPTLDKILDQETMDVVSDWAEDYGQSAVDWWGSYDDTFKGKADRLKDLVVDMPAHGIVNAAQFLKDLGTQGTETLWNMGALPFSPADGRPLFSNEDWYKWDASKYNIIPEALRKNQLWALPGTGENPYENPIYDKEGNLQGYNNQAFLKMRADADRRTIDKFRKEILTKDVQKKLTKEVDEAMPFADWSRKNQDRPQSEYFKDKDEYYNQLVSDRYDKVFNEMWNEDMNRSFMEDFGIGYTDEQGRRIGDKDAFSDWNWSEEQWKPPHSMFGYNTDRKKFLRQTEIVPELAADFLLTRGLGTANKQALKQGSKLNRIEEFKIPETWRKGNSRIKPDWQEGIFSTNAGRDIINRNFR